MNLKPYAPIYFALSNDNILDQKFFNDQDKKAWPYQISLLKTTIKLRDSITTNNYEKILIDFILMNEGRILYPYVCPAGIVTLGTGFALTYKNSFKLTDFGKELLGLINFDIINFETNILNQINEKKKIINEVENEKILMFILKKFKNEIIIFMPFFRNLPINIQISLQSLYYNSHVFIKGGILSSLNSFIRTKNEIFLEDVLFRISRNCNLGAPYKDSKKFTNNHYWKGIQYRRYREMIMSSNVFLDQKIFL